MRLNKYLTPAMLAGLLLTAATFSPALGQAQTLTPKSAWSVTKIDRAGQKGASYCTLSRGYDGVMLSLGRNQTEEYSLAIDFQNDVFEKDKAVKINLQPGPGQIRSYDMMPSSPKAIVIRLGWDSGFFDALNKSQQMKVSIADRNYSFAVPEIVKGQEQLKSCTDELASAAKSAAPNDVAQSKDVLQAEPGKSSKDFNAAKADIPVPDKAVVAQQERRVLDKFADGMREENPEINHAMTGKSILKAEPLIAAKESRNVSDDVSAATPVELVKRPPLNAANDQKLTAELKAAQAKLAALSAENDKLKDKATKNTTDAASADAKKLQDAERQIQAAQDDNKRLQAQLKTLQAATTAAPSPNDLAVAQSHAKALAEENAKLVKDLKASREKLATLSAAPVKLDRSGELQQIKKVLTDVTAENDSLKQKTASATAMSSDAQQQVQTLTSQNKTLLDKISQAEQEKAKLPKPEELAQINGRLQTLAQQKGQVEAELKMAQAKLAAVSAAPDLTKDLADAKIKAAELAAQNAQLKKDLSDSQAKITTAAVVAKDSVTKAQSAELTNIQKHLNEVIAENDALKKKTAVAGDAQKQLAEAQTQAKALQDKIKQLEIDRRKAEDLAAAAQAAIKEPASGGMTPLPDESTQKLEKQLASIGNDDVAQKQIASLSPDNKALQDKIAALQAEPKTETAKPDDKTAAALAQAQADIATLSAKNDQLEDSLKKAQIRIAEAAINTETRTSAQMADLQVKLTAANADNQELTKKLEDVQAKLDNKQVLAAGGNWDLEQATKRYNEAQREVARLGKEITDNQKVCETQKASIEKTLFDPAIADQKQRDKLSDLQNQLDAANQKLAAAGRGSDTALSVVVPVQRAPLDPVPTATAENDKPVASGNVPLLPPNSVSRAGEPEQHKSYFSGLRDGVSHLKDKVIGATAKADASSVLTPMIDEDVASAESKPLSTAPATPTDMNNVETAAGGVTIYKDGIPAANVPSDAPAAQIVSAVMQQPAPAEPASGGIIATGYTPDTVKSLLQKSGLGSARVTKTSAGLKGADNFAFTDGGKLKGLASIKVMKTSEFKKLVDQYVAYEKSQCKGDFAAVPSTDTGSSKRQMATYETACVGKSQSVSSSAIFFEEGGRFVAVASQIDAADMDAAMDNRDKVADFIRKM